ncbi:hypothetical protein [Polaromonas sp.]|uniref:hypothetical protein n=1 Tax=Polaromonas sp. TaxID=1869339 RepID=UPI003267F7F4
MNTMKTTLLLLAAAALSGCAVYPSAPIYETYSAVPYGVVQPTYIYGGAVYSYGGYRAYPRGYHRPAPHAAPHYAPSPDADVPHRDHGAREHLHERLREGPRLPHHRW